MTWLLFTTCMTIATIPAVKDGDTATLEKKSVVQTIKVPQPVLDSEYKTKDLCRKAIMKVSKETTSEECKSYCVEAMK